MTVTWVLGDGSDEAILFFSVLRNQLLVSTKTKKKRQQEPNWICKEGRRSGVDEHEPTLSATLQVPSSRALVTRSALRPPLSIKLRSEIAPSRRTQKHQLTRVPLWFRYSTVIKPDRPSQVSPRPKTFKGSKTHPSGWIFKKVKKNIQAETAWPKGIMCCTLDSLAECFVILGQYRLIGLVFTSYLCG